MGDYVILTTLLGKKVFRLAKVEETGDVYFKKERINLKTLIGAQYNSIHRLDRSTRTLKHAGLTQEQLREILDVSFTFTELNVDDESKDNRLINDDGLAQKLDRDDIESLKNQGMSGDVIIKTLVENSNTFKERNVFSQEKYLKKKQAKYSNLIRVLKPNPTLLTEMYYSQGPMKINNLRIDSLAQMLTACNVRSGAKFMVVDTNMGLLTAAIIDRLAGHSSMFTSSASRDYGECIQIYLDDAPVSSWRQSVDALNLSPAVIDRCLSAINIKKLYKWEFDNDTKPKDELDTEIETKEDITPIEPKEVDESSNVDEPEYKKQRLDEKTKRKATRIKEENRAIDALKNKDMDGLLIVTRNHDPTNILTFLIRFLGIAQPFAVFSLSIDPLISCYQSLKGIAINSRITETWFRNYQVLDSRTRPEMNMSGSGGYLLTGIKVDFQ
uniref:tRNA (adenine(58)-N(1))-methyltransferase non-catalytic subunit TRM6 n=2 Tax=Tetranychus urticae TaxID=32264 RepID=T1JZQ1_TETUR